jgi:hypothetical protein
MKRGLATLAIASLVAVGGGASVASADTQVLKAPAAPATVEGTQGVINAILNVHRTLNHLSVLNHVGSIRIVSIERSLNKVINNSDVLSHKVVVLHHFLRNCNVLACFAITNVLNKNHVNIGDIVAVKLLSNNRIRLFKRP